MKSKLLYFRDVTALKRSRIKEKIAKRIMEIDDTVMYYIVWDVLLQAIECR